MTALVTSAVSSAATIARELQNHARIFREERTALGVLVALVEVIEAHGVDVEELIEAHQALRAWGEARKPVLGTVPKTDAEQHALDVTWHELRTLADRIAAGNHSESPKGCWACNGMGSVTETSQWSQGQVTTACGVCAGRGKV